MMRAVPVVMMICGVAVAVCGVGMIYPPLAMVVGGGMVARVGLKMSQQKGTE